MNKMEEEKPEEKKEVHNKKTDLTKKLRENPWILSTFVLGIMILILLIGNLSGTISGKSVSEGEAEAIFLNTLKAQGANIDDIEITDITSQNGFYKISFDYQEEPYPVQYYLTNDGSLMGVLDSVITEESSSSESTESQEVPKSDKPIVELFIMSYCPYGTQAEKGIIPVIELLKDKIDFRMRYVSYLMHGEKEAEENLREYCIEEIAPEKYLDYMNCFLEGDGNYDIDSDGDGNNDLMSNGNNINNCLTKAGIDTTKLENCISEADKEFSITENLNSGASYPKFNVDADLNEEYEIAGSPTLVINGQVVSSGRDSASYLNVICSVFNNAPTECNTQLSSTTPSPYFGWDGTGSSTSAQC